MESLKYDQLHTIVTAGNTVQDMAKLKVQSLGSYLAELLGMFPKLFLVNREKRSALLACKWAWLMRDSKLCFWL